MGEFLRQLCLGVYDLTSTLSDLSVYKEVDEAGEMLFISIVGTGTIHTAIYNDLIVGQSLVQVQLSMLGDHLVRSEYR